MAVADYIAETDETGRVTCVWIKPQGQIAPSVFDAAEHQFEPDARNGFFGAASEDIIAWMSRFARRVTR